MTEQKPVNPPAFPTTPVRVDGVPDADCYHGMTLRDYFAAAVINGVGAGGVMDSDQIHAAATHAYKVAYAVLKAREPSPTEEVPCPTS